MRNSGAATSAPQPTEQEQEEEMIRTIHLHGRLGKQFGRTHRYDVATPAEAIRALEANHPGFANAILQLGEKGYAYRVLHGKRANIGIERAEELNDPASGDIRIIPEIAGAKKGGIGQLIAGIAMLATVYFTGGAASGYWASVGAGSMTLGSSTVNMGLMLALGGVAQMLSPTMKASQGSEDKADPSYVFNGAVNTLAQGHPVPIGYGEMIVGSAVISAGIDVDEVGAPLGALGPTWTNPLTGEVENYPAPTLVWDYNLDDWALPDGTELLFDTTETEASSGWDSTTYATAKSNWRTADGRVPVMSSTPERWDIQNPTVFATPKKSGDVWYWYVRGGTVPLVFSDERKRFEVPARNYTGSDGLGGLGGPGGSGGVSAGDGNAGDGGTGGGDGSGSGGGSGTA